jgi:hypothetical protein
MHANYYVIAKLFEEVNYFMKAKEEGKLRKEGLIYPATPSQFFLLQNLSRKMITILFFKDLMF